MKNFIKISLFFIILQLLFNFELNIMTNFVSDYINTHVKTQINTYSNIFIIKSKFVSYYIFPEWIDLDLKIKVVQKIEDINKRLIHFYGHGYRENNALLFDQILKSNKSFEFFLYKSYNYSFLYSKYCNILVYYYMNIIEFLYILILLIIKIKIELIKFTFFSFSNFDTIFLYKKSYLNLKGIYVKHELLFDFNQIKFFHFFINETYLYLQIYSLIFFYFFLFILFFSLNVIYTYFGKTERDFTFTMTMKILIFKYIYLLKDSFIEKELIIIKNIKKFINIIRIFFILFFMFEISLYILKNNTANLNIIHTSLMPFITNNFHYTYNEFLNNFLLGYDGVTLLFLFLTLLVFGMVHLNLGTKKFTIYHYQFLIFLTLLLEIQLIITFTVQNLLIFYIFFESTLIPMFFIVGFFGTRSRKVIAAFYLFLYTIAGSLFLLLGILIVYSYTKTFVIPEIYQYNFTINTQILLWLLFFFGFAVKLPSVPFHLWLPEAHVEAPAVGSIILAAILLKLGGYGLLRVSLKMFPEACIFFQPLVFVIGLISIIYASLTAVRQTDIKRVIAYSSIAHMNYALIGLFCFNKLALVGSFYLMFGHGLVSGGLFLLIGILYDRYGTRSIFYYGGLMKVMPHFSVIFLILSLANMGFPGLINFIGEFLIMLGIAEENILLFFLTSLGFILSAVYSIWLFNRLAFGNLKSNYLKKYKDITEFEVKANFVKIIIFFIFYFGISAEFLTLLLDQTLTYYLVDYYFNIEYLKNFDINYFK